MCREPDIAVLKIGVRNAPTADVNGVAVRYPLDQGEVHNLTAKSIRKPQPFPGLSNRTFSIK
jgi:hypothetical protein